MPARTQDKVKQKWQMHYERCESNEATYNLVIKFNDNETNDTIVGFIDCETGILVEYPFNTQHWDSEKFLKPKYSNIREIRVQLPANIMIPETDEPEDDDTYRSDNNFWGYIPGGLYYGFRGGLGLYYKYQFIIDEIEAACDCDILTIGFSELPINIKDNSINISAEHFSEWIKELDRIRARGNCAIARVNKNYISNDLAIHLGGHTSELRYGRNLDSQYVTHMANNDLSESDANSLVQAAIEQVSRNQNMRLRIPALKREIEITSLSTLIEDFQEGLSKRRTEKYWQHFFEVNPFALQQILSTPFALITSHAYVDTGGLLGNGASITDYFGTNPITSNACIVEIKQPTTSLINKTSYRNGVYAASKELSGSIIQIADQASSFISAIHIHRSKSGLLEMQAHNVEKCILIGNTREFNSNPEMTKSFELYRQTCANVTIITYDEALEQLKSLRAFLSDSVSENSEALQ